MRRCGDCANWCRTTDYAWGTCLAPLPMWVSATSGPIFADTIAEDCDAYCPVEKQKAARLRTAPAPCRRDEQGEFSRL
jgi:hypothetical protein